MVLVFDFSGDFIMDISGLLVLFELEKSDERFVASWVCTFVNFGVLVLENVVSQAGLGGEGGGASFIRADKRSLSGVDSQVILEGIGSLE